LHALWRSRTRRHKLATSSNVAVRIAAVCIAASPGIKNDNALLKNAALLPGGIVGSLLVLARSSSQDEIT
jgi:hypothetical protein